MNPAEIKEEARGWSLDNTVRMNTTLSSHQAHVQSFEAGAMWTAQMMKDEQEQLIHLLRNMCGELRVYSDDESFEYLNETHYEAEQFLKTLGDSIPRCRDEFKEPNGGSK